jgi:hypothetical protein
MSSIAKRGLPKASLILEAEPAIERQCPYVAILDADSDPVYAPAIEAGRESCLQ